MGKTDYQNSRQERVIAAEALANAEANVELLQQELEKVGPNGATAGGLVALTEARKQALEACEQTTRERDQAGTQYAALVTKSKSTETHYLRLKSEYEVLKKELEKQVDA